MAKRMYGIVVILSLLCYIGTMVYAAINADIKQFLNGLGGAALLIVPFVLFRLLKLEFPLKIAAFYTAFVFLSVFLGSVLRVYDVIFFWDIFLHFFSGAFLACVALSLINIWSGKDALHEFNPFFVAIYVLVFAMACGTLWEFYEFTMDRFTTYEMQVYTLLPDGTVDTGIIDTMSDEISAFVSALAYSISVGIRLRKKKYKSLENTLIRRKTDG